MNLDSLRGLSPHARAAWLVAFARHTVGTPETDMETIVKVAEGHRLVEWSSEQIGEAAERFQQDTNEAFLFLGVMGGL